jgi:hypothetical protein
MHESLRRLGGAAVMNADGVALSGQTQAQRAADALGPARDKGGAPNRRHAAAVSVHAVEFEQIDGHDGEDEDQDR